MFINPIPGFIVYNSSSLEDRDLSPDLKLHRPGHRPQGVEVLDLRPGAQGSSDLADGDVGVNSDLSSLHPTS